MAGRACHVVGSTTQVGLTQGVRAHMKHSGYFLALLLSIPTFAAGAPPVEYPQACAPTYCVQIIATHPDQPQKFVIQHTAKMGTATMTEIGRAHVRTPVTNDQLV